MCWNIGDDGIGPNFGRDFRRSKSPIRHPQDLVLRIDLPGEDDEVWLRNGLAGMLDDIFVFVSRTLLGRSCLSARQPGRGPRNDYNGINMVNIHTKRISGRGPMGRTVDH